MVRKTFQFGKMDYYNRGKKINLIEANVELSNRHGFPEFTASIGIWNGSHTNYVACGQMFDEIKRVPINNALYQEIKRLWKAYHLNGMHAGTKIQELALTNASLKGVSNYEKAVEYLKRIGLYEVELTPTEAKYNPTYAGRPYKYGHGWLYHPIPANDMAKIKAILDM